MTTDYCERKISRDTERDCVCGLTRGTWYDRGM